MTRSISLSRLVSACLLLVSVTDASQLEARQIQGEHFTLRRAIGHRLKRPIAMTSPRSRAWRERHRQYPLEGAFIAEQGGAIWWLRRGKLKRVVDLSAKVYEGHNEEGLLGLVHAPDFPRDPRLFVYYSARAPRRTCLAELTLRGGGPWSLQQHKVLLEIRQPYGNHNGGGLAFGTDGTLFVGVGVGGAAGDPLNAAQDLSQHLGKILRLDVSQPGQATAPRDNPFVGYTETRAEIWAYGLRNPWRISVDPLHGSLWVGDVGQDRWEEVNMIPRGGNLGWKWREAASDYRGRRALNHQRLSKENRATLVDPVAAYGHQLGSSITGGLVYRGEAAPRWQGTYLFADFVSGRLWGLDAERIQRGGRPAPQELARLRLNVASFAEDAAKELYLLAFDGYIYQLRWR
ncbi:MAG: PQQ-dependent sugar dehydrogenase [Myxococcota bacterium]|nr:PQQ-dependent sugar dehydrogenase [Myxococcota bacterium]